MMTSAPEPTGSLETALAHTERLLQANPALAAEQAEEILKAVPRHPVATLLLGAARRLCGEPAEALRALEPLVADQPNWAAAHFELGLALDEAYRPDAALHALRRAVSLKPHLPDAWRAIGDHLAVRGDVRGADAAYAQHIKTATQDPRLLAPAAALVEGLIVQAEALLRAHLKQYPTDVAAIRMLAEVAARLGRNYDAEVLLERCLELAPSFHAARFHYAIVLQRQNKVVAALRHVDQLEKSTQRNAAHRNLRAVILGKIGEYQQSLDIYAEVLAAYPREARIWLSYGHTLATAGREQESIAAYRESIRLLPSLGEAYWSLANLKTFRFDDADVRSMRSQLAGTELSDDDRLHFDFALGKALEDLTDYADSFVHYERANRLRKTHLDYAADETTAFVQRSKALFTREFFGARAGAGNPAADPIFVVGMPRAGSTLIEQILASHSQVEGTMELSEIIMMAAALAGPRTPATGPKYPGVLENMSADELAAFGTEYLAHTRIQRKSDRPFFIDKMPNNFLHVGLIRLALPNARIIDARRHPMACCFSGFKQQFALGNRFSYSLEDIGRYYRDYVDLMSHMDRVLPGTIHRVIYENMIDDTEGEVRRLLEFCGLPFESGCLRFYENLRPVRTASSQQVRKPIFREGVDHWRNYEQWLRPLEAVLGPVLDSYPTPPEY
jgi:tetratricopeptide (TPR) repeat protein